MFLLSLIQASGGVHFDATITLGNILTIILVALAIIKFWSAQIEAKKDLEWRISNLEKWRGEHMIDSDSRDLLLKVMTKIVERLEWVEDARQKAKNAPPGKRRLNDF